MQIVHSAPATGSNTPDCRRHSIVVRLAKTALTAFPDQFKLFPIHGVKSLKATQNHRIDPMVVFIPILFVAAIRICGEPVLIPCAINPVIGNVINVQRSPTQPGRVQWPALQACWCFPNPRGSGSNRTLFPFAGALASSFEDAISADCRDQPCIIELLGKCAQPICHRKGVEIGQNVQYPLILRQDQGVPEIVNEGLTQP